MPRACRRPSCLSFTPARPCRGTLGRTHGRAGAGSVVGAANKTPLPGRRLPERQSTVDAVARNQVILLLNILADEVVHAGRCLMEAATREEWSLRRFRERGLRAAARAVISGRRVTMTIGEPFADFWQPLWPQLER